MATSRAVLVTIGQIAFYDQIKGMLFGTAFFKKDNEILHFTSSFCAVSCLWFYITFYMHVVSMWKVACLYYPPFP